jgi:hypothetical protein
VQQALTALMILSSTCVFAQTAPPEASADLHEFFAQLHQNPKAVMMALPEKSDAQGNPVEDTSLFSKAEIENRDFIDAKNNIRDQITFDPASLVMAQIDQSNEPRSLLEGSQLTNIRDLGNPRLRSGTVAVQPWSSDYWATFRGGLSYRYSDNNFLSFESWQKFKPVFSQLIGVNFQDPIKNDDRSPAEKYDMLMGDDHFNFTKWWVRKAINAEDNTGDIATWQGICHGWAPASYLVPRPTKAVSVTLPDGQALQLFPDDLKALADALYANNRTSSAFVGKRCNEKDPKTDQNGRLISSACWDLNPGSFHEIMINRVGIDKKSLVMDATYDYEVWNQPIVKYELTYFNPQTSDLAPNYQGAVIALKDYKDDLFSKYRSSKAVSVVGVQMDVTYTVETYSQHADLNSASQDALRKVRYLYDLELDKDGNIVGGEWYQNAHPDFMWSPLQDSKPLAFSEPSLYLAWNPLTGQPTDQAKEIAVRAAANGQVLNSIVMKLIQLSSQ